MNLVDAPQAWDITQGSSAAPSAIIGIGIDWDHEDLLPNIWQNLGEDADGDNRTLEGGQFDPGDLNGVDNDGNGKIDDFIGWNFGTISNDVWSGNNHDTRIAGILAARSNNSIGIAGLAGGWGTMQGCSIMTLLVDEISPKINSLGIADAIVYAVDMGAKVINCSFEAEQISEIDAAIADAYNNNVLIVCAAGNYQSGHLTHDIAYPASHSQTIAVGGTTTQDKWWNFSSYDTNPSDGIILDVAGPAQGVYSTQNNNTYGTSMDGTSFAAPHVAALAGLMFTINSQLTTSQARQIIRDTAEKIDPNSTYTDQKGNQVSSSYTNGYSRLYGYGRINAYQALLLTHAYSSTSVSSEAIGSNSARHLVKESTNNYHLVFESGISSGGSVLGEVFYRKSTSGGATWNAPIRLSTGNEQNRYPCLAGRGTNLFAVWQRYDGSSHDIHFRKSTNSGGTWTNASELAANVGTSAPLPVIASPATNELMVVYRSGNNLKWNRSSDYGTTWPSNKAGTLNAGSGEALNSPSITATKTPWGSATIGLAYATKEIPNASHIITRYYNDSNNTWSSATNISSSLPGYLSQHARPSVSHSGDPAQNYVHVAWDAWDSQYGARVIIHRVGNPGIWNFGSQYYEFHYQTEDRPNIAGLASDDAMMVFQNGTTKYFYGRYDGASWNIQFPPLTGVHPSLASGSTSTKYLWTSGSSSPYTVNITSSTFSKISTEDSLYTALYERSAAVVDTATGAWLDVRVKELALKTNVGAKSDIAFANVENSLALNIATVFDGIASQSFQAPADAESLMIHYAISGENISEIKNASPPIFLELMIVDSGGDTTRLPVLTVGAESLEKKDVRLSVPISKFADTKIIVKTRVNNISSNANLVASLGHVYQIVDGVVPETQSLQSGTDTPANFSLQSFPNPFNPSTNIQFSLPAEGMVTLRIYNLQGQLVRELLREQRAAGAHTVMWDGRNDRGSTAASGIYFLRLESGKQAKVSRLTLVR